MKKRILTALAAIALPPSAHSQQARVNPTDPQSTCHMCPGTYIPVSELDAYVAKARAERLVDQQVRAAREFNGPGNNGNDIKEGVAHNLKPGDVVVIPAGTGHGFTKIDDHIIYLMIRIDPDKVTPVKGEAQSKDYLSKPAR